MIACRELSPEVTTGAACSYLDIARATYYRNLQPQRRSVTLKQPAPPLALAAAEHE